MHHHQMLTPLCGLTVVIPSGYENEGVWSFYSHMSCLFVSMQQHIVLFVCLFVQGHIAPVMSMAFDSSSTLLATGMYGIV